MKNFAFLLITICFATGAFAQVPDGVNGVLQNARTKNNTRGSDTTKHKTGNKLDTLGFEHRDDLADSIAISYRYFNDPVRRHIDSSVNDFDRYFPVPSTYQYLGNTGAAAFPLIFSPYMKAGWDPGFHAFDVYRFDLENTKFYRTTGPFSMLAYQLAGGQEQILQAMHTQSPKPNMNFGFEYRLISAPGYFVTQNTNHNNVRLFGNYTGKRKRYNGSMIIISNAEKVSENGGIVNDADLQDPNKKQRFTVPVNLGAALPYQPNPFQASVKTGNIYKEGIFFLRQSYDLGKRDSVAVNDSTQEYLFYPKLRLQHTLTLQSENYQYKDALADSALYSQWYGVTLPHSTDSFKVNERWRSLTNDFSLVQFPDTKNPAQYLLAGISAQTLKATTASGDYNFYNVIAHGEYRNLTRNKLWNVFLNGSFYANGLNSGDYEVHADLNRYFNRKFGNVKVYFNNVNRTPSFIFDDRSSFHFAPNTGSYKKENITSFGAEAANPLITLGFNNYLITNYSYFYDYYHSTQYNKPINLLELYASKRIKLTRNIFYYADAAVQQTAGNTPIHVPFLFTRSRLSYEGSLYKNLVLSAGLEVRYYSPYHADNYSPVIGQFTPQDTVTISNRPDVSAFLHFRIKGFTLYFRGQNLNTLDFRTGGFVDNNFAAPHYPMDGFMLRFGIRWWFVK